MLRTWVSGKLHGITVTDASVDYHGSVTIGEELMSAAGISTGEQVHVVNLATGHRWVTYALPGKTGAFTLNGGGARLGAIGDQCVVLTYAQAVAAPPAPVVFCDRLNQIVDRGTYNPADPAVVL